jgi:hypothetical protein
MPRAALDPVAFIVGGGSIVLACASDRPTFPPNLRGLVIPAGLNVGLPDFLTLCGRSGRHRPLHGRDLRRDVNAAAVDGGDLVASASDSLVLLP